MVSKNEALLSFGIISGVIRALEPDLAESIHKVLVNHCEIVMNYMMKGEGSIIPAPFTNLYATNPCKSDSGPWDPGQVKCGGVVK